jgi:hypothetical protein
MLGGNAVNQNARQKHRVSLYNKCGGGIAEKLDD